MKEHASSTELPHVENFPPEAVGTALTEPAEKTGRRGRPPHRNNGGGNNEPKPFSFMFGDDPKSNFLSRMKPSERLDHLLGIVRQEGIHITVLQAVMKLHLMRHREVNLKDLSLTLDVTSANVTCLVDNMERLGLASRIFVDTNRRQILLSLTPKGEALIAWAEGVLSAKPAKAKTPSNGSGGQVEPKIRN